MSIDICIIIGYFLILIVIGIICSRNLKTINDFSISNKKYGVSIIFITMCCSFLGGGFSFGNATEVFEKGIGNIFVLFGFSVGQILIGKYLANRMDKFNGCISIGDILGNTYGRKLKILTGLFSFCICSAILGAQVGTMGHIFKTFLGVPTMIGVLIGFGVILVYSTCGGLKADIITDIFQFAILIIGLPLLLIFGLKEVGGVYEVITNVPKEYFKVLNGTDIIGFISLFFALMIGEMLVPPYVQRLLIGKSSKETAKATLFSGYVSILFFILTGVLGLIAFAYNPNMDSSGAIPELVKGVLPVGASGLIISAMIGIVLSTADTFLNSASVGIINDFYLPLKNNSITEREKLKLVRIANIVIGIIAIATAAIFPNIFDILIFGYSFWAPVLLVPVIFVLFGKPLSKVALWAGMIIGTLSTILWTIVYNNPYQINGLIIGFVANFFIAMLMNKNTKMFYVDL